jgi:transcriptional regulator
MTGRKPFFAPEQDREIAKRYLAGETLKQIAATYNVSYGPVLMALKRQNIKRRSKSDYGWKDTPENRAEIIKLWSNGTSVANIARIIHARDVNVSTVLRESGIKARLGGKHHRFSKEQEASIIIDYELGMSFRTLVDKYGGSAPVLKGVLIRNGVDVRRTGRKAFWTPDRIEWLRQQHEHGRSQESIAKDLGCSQTIISRKLIDFKISSPQKPRSGENHPSWKGGRIVDGQGYIRVKVGEEESHLVDETISGAYVMEHRLVMARMLGRPLTSRESVHHINNVRNDNRPENLQLRQGKHGKGAVFHCASCGSNDIIAVPLALPGREDER